MHQLGSAGHAIALRLLIAPAMLRIVCAARSIDPLLDSVPINLTDKQPWYGSLKFAKQRYASLRPLFAAGIVSPVCRTTDNCF